VGGLVFIFGSLTELLSRFVHLFVCIFAVSYCVTLEFV